jgi:hypothetical protein
MADLDFLDSINDGETQLSADLDITEVTSFTVVDGSKLPLGGSGTTGFIVGLKSATTIEYILCSNRVGNTVYIDTRGYDNTSASTWISGTTVENDFTSATKDELEDGINSRADKDLTITVNDGLEINSGSSVDLTGNVSLNLLQPTQEGSTDGRYYSYVDGGIESITSSSQVGYLKITLPQLWSDTIVDFTISTSDAKATALSTNNSYKIRIYGELSSSSSAWVNPDATLLMTKQNGVNVRFGHDGSNAILWIAESTTSWDKVKIAITDLVIGGSNDDYEDWRDDWIVEIDATTDIVQATISAQLNATEFLGTTDDITEGSTNEYDKTVVLTGSGVAEITGTYPSFDINVDPIVNVPVAFFFSDTSYTAISGYYEMYYSEMGEAASNIPISINTSTWTEVGTWIQVPEIDADGFVVQGTGTFNLTCAVSGGGTSQQGQVRATIYLRDSGGTETELYSVSAVSVDSSVDSKILTYTVTDEEPYEATDRFVVKIEALAILTPNTADTFTLYMEDDYNSNWTLPVSSLYLSRNFQNRFRFQELTADYTVTNADRTNTVFAVTPSTVDITLSVTSADWTEGDTLSFMKKGTSSYDVIIEIDSSTFATLTLENQSLRIIKHDTSGGHFDIISDYNPATVSVPSSRTITVGDGLEIDNDSSADLSSDRTINLTVPTQVGTSNGIFFPYVDGGVEDFATGTASGWIKVLLPMTLSALTTLSANITVDLVFNLHDLTPVAYPEDMSCKIRISGLLSYADSEWHYNKVTVIEGKENSYEVKLGNDGTNFCFWITITDELSTPTFYLTDIMIGGTSVNYDDWAEGWTITNVGS